LEALAARRPVLVTPETNLGRHVQEYGAGVVVEPTAISIAEGLHQLSQADHASYEAMQRGAERLASEKFSWPQVTQKMIDLYELVLRGPPAMRW
jgi:glycosyltransferase involved in cell wall biosynthesis